jgi:hypothetical protein
VLSTKRRRRQQPEAAIQRAVIAHLHARAVPNCFWFHTPLGGKRPLIGAAILKGMGATPGIPDLIFICGGKVFALELKTSGRRPTPVQVETMNRMKTAGAIVGIAFDIDEALGWLTQWRLLRPNRNDSRDTRTDCHDELRASPQKTKESTNAN